jgi:hypothetical protein
VKRLQMYSQVPSELMGRWIGINRFFRMSLSAALAILGGIIWDKLGPQYAFIIFIVLDLVIRIPLFLSMPETLHSSFKLKTDTIGI